MSGSVRVLINQTGRVVADTIVIPGDGIDNNTNMMVDEANEPGEDDGVDNNTNGTIDENTEVSPRTIVMPFASAARRRRGRDRRQPVRDGGAERAS